jgi:hypothetical protein
VVAGASERNRAAPQPGNGAILDTLPEQNILGAFPTILPQTKTDYTFSTSYIHIPFYFLELLVGSKSNFFRQSI